MHVQVEIDPILTQNHSMSEMQANIKNALVVWEYLRGELSIGEVAEYYQKSITDTLEWLNSIGVPTV